MCVKFVVYAKERGGKEKELSNDGTITCGDLVEVGQRQRNESEDDGNEEGADGHGLLDPSALEIV